MSVPVFSAAAKKKKLKVDNVSSVPDSPVCFFFFFSAPGPLCPHKPDLHRSCSSLSRSLSLCLTVFLTYLPMVCQMLVHCTLEMCAIFLICWSVLAWQSKLQSKNKSKKKKCKITICCEHDHPHTPLTYKNSVMVYLLEVRARHSCVCSFTRSCHRVEEREKKEAGTVQTALMTSMELSSPCLLFLW